MAIIEVRVGYPEKDSKGQHIAREVTRTMGGMSGLEEVRTAKVYRLEGTTREGAQHLAKSLLVDPIVQVFTVNEALITDAQHVVEVGYKP